jgi:hypothetical protein
MLQDRQEFLILVILWISRMHSWSMVRDNFEGLRGSESRNCGSNNGHG